MRAVELVFAVGWAAFWLYWLVAAFSMKRGRVPWSRELRIRAVIVVVVILLTRLGAFRGHGLNTDPWRAGIGLVLFALGLGFAIWARMHIGRNWGTPMTQKDEPELVTSGPYHLVRHPIYSGILVAGVGTAVALSWLWLTAVVLAGVYFLYSATVEERYMTEQFPDNYPAVQALDQDARAVHLLTWSRSRKRLCPSRLSPCRNTRARGHSRTHRPRRRSCAHGGHIAQRSLIVCGGLHARRDDVPASGIAVGSNVDETSLPEQANKLMRTVEADMARLAVAGDDVGDPDRPVVAAHIGKNNAAATNEHTPHLLHGRCRAGIVVEREGAQDGGEGRIREWQFAALGDHELDVGNTARLLACVLDHARRDVDPDGAFDP